MRLNQLLPHLDALAPLHLAEAWDNVGLLTGDPDAAVDSILLTIDTTPAVLAEAQACGAQLVLSYHPLFIKASKRIGPKDVLWQATRADVAVYSPHTALDAAAGGTNDVLAELCGLGARVPLAPAEPGGGKAGELGAGRVGTLSGARAVPLAELAASLRQKAGLGHLQFAAAPGREGRPIERVAVAAGAGDGLVEAALGAGAVCLVTGELRHHTLLACMAAGLSVVLLGHDGSERPALNSLAERLRGRLPGVKVALSAHDRSRLQVVTGTT